MTNESVRKEFEGYILNNRLDGPKLGSIRRDSCFTDDYIDPRLNLGWRIWQHQQQKIDAQAKRIMQLERRLKADAEYFIDPKYECVWQDAHDDIMRVLNNNPYPIR